ncbi:MAG: penicillin-binding protein 2 [Oscillospiraceae bacterium]|nr:penicillin-binding protein 2 [Oscillospiraceae bacterium]
MFALNQRRVAAAYIFIMLAAGVLLFKLYNISVSDYSKIMPALTGQYTRRIDVTERRGFIFDRNGVIISGFADGYNCVVDPSKIFTETFDGAAERIFGVRENLNVTFEDIRGSLISGRPFVIRIREDINNAYMTSFQAYKRNESANPPALHLLGYVGRDGAGIGGIEEKYNDFLKNTTSAKITAEYNSDALRQSFVNSPVRISDYGYDRETGMVLTIDLNLQKKAEEIADRYLNKGAVIIASAKTGEILAGVSRPVYSLDNIADYITSGNGEFINRAFGSFTPGSVFKTIVAAAALEICEDDNYNYNNCNYYEREYNCEGEINAGGQIFRCHRRWGHGLLGMSEAYAESCNTYFMDLALEIGYEKIYETAKNFGIGENNLLDGLNIKSGNIPDVKSPPPAFIANTAIGQGELLITPLEAVRIFCAIANDGVMPELSLIKALVFGDEISDVRNTNSRKVISDNTVKYLLEMTQACVEYGTGISASPEYGIAGGKTSSAESGQFTEIAKETEAETETQRVQIVHSWFSGYYPANSDSPVYAISVIAEGGVTENIRSSVIFKEICDYLALNMR